MRERSDRRESTGYVGAGRSGVDHTWHGTDAREGGQIAAGIRS